MRGMYILQCGEDWWEVRNMCDWSTCSFSTRYKIHPAFTLFQCSFKIVDAKDDETKSEKKTESTSTKATKGDNLFLGDFHSSVEGKSNLACSACYNNSDPFFILQRSTQRSTRKEKKQSRKARRNGILWEPTSSSVPAVRNLTPYRSHFAPVVRSASPNGTKNRCPIIFSWNL